MYNYALLCLAYRSFAQCVWPLDTLNLRRRGLGQRDRNLLKVLEAKVIITFYFSVFGHISIKIIL